MKVFHGRSEGVLSEQRDATFTGAVWADPIMPTTDNVALSVVGMMGSAHTIMCFSLPARVPTGIPTSRGRCCMCWPARAGSARKVKHLRLFDQAMSFGLAPTSGIGTVLPRAAT